MTEKKQILEAILKRMQRDGMTEAQLAEKLSVDESLVKSHLKGESLSVDTLEEICKAVGASLGELLGASKSTSTSQKDSFTEEQERALTNDEFMFFLFFMVARGYSLEAIHERFSNRSPENIDKSLRDLEKLQLIQYSSEKELQSLISSNARIRPGGPLWKKYSFVGIQEFFNSSFGKENEFFKLSMGYLSDEGAAQLKKRFQELEEEIKNLLIKEQEKGKSASKRSFYWIANSFRPMDSSVLQIIAEKSRLL
ncbi:MAG: hypothetical protein RL189_1325 [Pseudomonadota bacterium]|jgi:transcriptional regulator with XRE-family HTH domain